MTTSTNDKTSIRAAPVVAPALEQYEEFQLRAEFRRVLGRARLRSALGSMIGRLCGLYEGLGLGRVATRADPALVARGPGAPIELALDDIAGTVDAAGRTVAGPPRLARGDYEAWAAQYAAIRERGPGRISGRFGARGFYVDARRSVVTRLEAARALGYDRVQAVAGA